MAKADLRIVLDKLDAVYVGGEVVRGSVHVRVDSDCRCKNLTVERLWRTHGSGNQDSGGRKTLSLFSGDWRAGDELVYPFEFIADEFPVSYYGEHVNIDWYVIARADVPWALDPTAEAELLVEPKPGAEAPKESFPKEQEWRAKSSMGLPHLILLPICFGMISLGYEILSGEGGLWIALLCMAMGFGFLAWGLRNVFAELKLGLVTISLEPKTLVPGEDAVLKVSLKPWMGLGLSRAGASITGVELAASGSGKNKKRHTHSLESMYLTLSDAKQLEAGKRVTFESQFRLPEDAPFSFEAGSNRIDWNLEVNFDIERWPDWNRKLTLRVLPTPVAGLLARHDWDEDDYEDDADFDEDENEDDSDIDEIDESDEGRGTTRDEETAADSVAATSGSSDLKRRERPPKVPWPSREARTSSRRESGSLTADVSTGASSGTPVDPAQAAVAPEVRAESPATPIGATNAELGDVVRRIAKAPAYDDQRQKLLAGAQDRVWSLSLEVDRVSWTSGIDAPAAMQGGRTLVGKAAGIDPLLNVRFPPSVSSEIDGLRHGIRKDVKARLTGWDSLYDRPVFDATD